MKGLYQPAESARVILKARFVCHFCLAIIMFLILL
jgi:hypothetical protein